MGNDTSMALNTKGDGTTSILSEDELKRMSRHVKELIPHDDVGEDEIIKITRLADSLFTTASFPTLTSTHRVAAWNTLCAFIDELTRSPIKPIWNLLWNHSIVRNACELFINDSQYARPKSAKQLLLTITNALRGDDEHYGLLEYIAERTLECLINDSSPWKTKAFVQLLSQFFAKNLVEASAINRVLSPHADVEAWDQAGSSEDPRTGSLLTCLFRWASYEDLGSVIGRCISVVLDKHNEASQRHAAATEGNSRETERPVWSAALNDCLQDDDGDIEQLRVHIFPILFKRSLPQYFTFLRAHGLDRLISSNEDTQADYPLESRFLHAALLSGKELGMIYESGDAEIHSDTSTLYMPVRSYGALLRSPDRNTRTTGLSLLVYSHSATRPFLPKALALLRRSLPSYFADTDANFRSEVFSLVQRLLDRLRAITAVLGRTTRPSAREDAADSHSHRTLQQHQDFLQWLLRFLAWELRPTASYQRHISALKCLSIVMRSGVDRNVPSQYWSKSASAETKWPFGLTILHPGLRQLLLDLLVDPFDDVRQTASSILSMYAKTTHEAGPWDGAQALDKTIERAEKLMLATGRADQADGVAHIYSLLAQKSGSGPSLDIQTQREGSKVLSQLLSDLERMLSNAQASLTAAANRYPMHGLLTSIRFILAQADVQLSAYEIDRLIDCLHQVWNTVKPILCNDAPEGYEHGDLGEITATTSKDILSYCWRALKESNLLLGAIVADKERDAEVCTSLGHLCFSQLAELRHRGAFSTVAQTWVVCCTRAATLPHAQGDENLLQQWYERAFDILKTKTTINTRRSAGLPSLLCGLLIADKSGEMLSTAFADLTTIAREPLDAALSNESSLPQVHALNCIKDILKNTRLGEQSERLVPSALRLAAGSLRSDAWAIRNCGLMLFRGVIDRLLGTSEVYLDDDALTRKRISVQQHPGLLDTVLHLLQISQSTDDGQAARFEGVFPALQMLQRMDIPSEHQQQAQDAVLALTDSPSWHVRDKAARTLAALFSNVEAPAQLIAVLEARLGRENAMHGILLCLKYMIKAATMLLNARCSWKGNAALVIKDLLLTILPALKFAWTNRYFAHTATRTVSAEVLQEYTNFRHEVQTSSSEELKQILREHDPRLFITDLNTKLHLDFFEELHSILQAPSAKPPEGALELASAARAAASQLVLGWQAPFAYTVLPRDRAETLLQLSSQDADAGVEFWKALRDAGGIADLQYADGLILPVAAKILSGSFQTRLKCEVQSFLLYLIDSGFAHHIVAKACSKSSSPLAKDGNQTYADQWLQLQAVVVDDRLGKSESSDHELSAFISTCKAAQADNGFFSREAAALAIRRMQHLWPYIVERGGSLAREAYLIIHDLLNDDDEDLRLFAARTTSRILRAANSPARETHFEPMTASQRLLAHMVSHLRNSRAFAHEAFTRAFNTELTVVDQLDTFSRPDTALFATEKQNLYIDPAREVRAWSQVLLQLPLPSIPKNLIRDLTFWIDEGLYTLTSRLTKGKRVGDNGALGWTSNAEVFTRGLQVVYGVEVLMGYLRKGGRLPMEGSEIVRRLVLFGKALEEVENGGNVLWRWEVERVLRGVVEGRVRLAWALAEEVMEKAVARE